jgi:hypothetical protein
MRSTIIALALMFLAPLVVLAQSSAPVVVPDDLAGIIAFFKSTHDSKAYALLFGGLLTVLVRLLTLAKPLAAKLPPEATKYLAMGLAMLGSIATGLLSGVVWYTVIIDGVTVGVAALGGWEFILKPLLSKLGASTSPTGPVKAP